MSKLGRPRLVVTALSPRYQVPQICFRKTSSHVRVGRSDWPGDTFEVYTHEEFAELEKHMVRLSIRMHDWEDDDEAYDRG